MAKAKKAKVAMRITTSIIGYTTLSVTTSKLWASGDSLCFASDRIFKWRQRYLPMMQIALCRLHVER